MEEGAGTTEDGTQQQLPHHQQLHQNQQHQQPQPPALPPRAEQSLPPSSTAWRFPRWVVTHSCCTLAACVCAVLLCTAIPRATGTVEMSEETRYDWIISEEDSSINMDALADARDQSPIPAELRGELRPADYEAPERRRRLRRRKLGSHFMHPRSEWDWDQKANMHYATDDGSSILTPAHLQTICKVENLFIADTGGQGSVRERVRDDVEDAPARGFQQLCKVRAD
jgi:hypothetical protein